MSAENLQSAIVDLEARIAYQEDTIDALNAQLAKQGRELDELRGRMQALYKKLDDLAYAWEQREAGADQEPPPPHY